MGEGSGGHSQEEGRILSRLQGKGGISTPGRLLYPRLLCSPEGCFFHLTFGLIRNQLGPAGWWESCANEAKVAA